MIPMQKKLTPPPHRINTEEVAFELPLLIEKNLLLAADGLWVTAVSSDVMLKLMF